MSQHDPASTVDTTVSDHPLDDSTILADDIIIITQDEIAVFLDEPLKKKGELRKTYGWREK